MLRCFVNLVRIITLKSLCDDAVTRLSSDSTDGRNQGSLLLELVVNNNNPACHAVAVRLGRRR